MSKDVTGGYGKPYEPFKNWSNTALMILIGAVLLFVVGGIVGGFLNLLDLIGVW